MKRIFTRYAIDSQRHAVRVRLVPIVEEEEVNCVRP
jgi:hypothetical protein